MSAGTQRDRLLLTADGGELPGCVEAHHRLSLPGRLLLFLGLIFSWSIGSLVTSANAQPSAAGPMVARSHSGQFSVYAAPLASSASRVSSLETNRNLARLDATLVPTSCERIKQLLWRELGVAGPWRGCVFLAIVPALSADDPITIASEQYADRWQYRLGIPELVDRTKYVRAIVQVLLLEIANRKSARSAEIPPWLLEGMTRELLVSSTKDELIPPPPRPGSDIMRPATTFTFVDSRRENPLEVAHAKLSIAPPLTFQQLSWPSEEQWGLTVDDVYSDSAQLFVHRLLGFEDGRACFRAMLEALPEHYNWQFAFLSAFASHFQRPLDVEKWWSLQVVQFTGRDLNQTWPREESWMKLDQLIRSEVQVRFGTNDLPVHAEVPLQTIVGAWDPVRQTQALQTKVHELDLLRPRVAPEFVPLVDEYRRVLMTYLVSREHPGSVLPFRKKAAVRHIADETVQQLAELDRQRLALKPPTQKPENQDSRSSEVGKALTSTFPNQAGSER